MPSVPLCIGIFVVQFSASGSPTLDSIIRQSCFENKTAAVFWNGFVRWLEASKANQLSWLEYSRDIFLADLRLGKVICVASSSCS